MKANEEEARDRTSAVIEMLRNGGETGWVDAKWFSTRIWAHKSKGRSGCSGMHRPDWFTTSERRGLIAIQRNLFSWQANDEKREKAT